MYHYYYQIEISVRCQVEKKAVKYNAMYKFGVFYDLPEHEG